MDYTWNPVDFVKSAGFHEIHWISCEIHQILWNPLDFLKSARFHVKYHWISWNPPDFMNVSFWVITKYRSFFRKTNQYIWEWEALIIHRQIFFGCTATEFFLVLCKIHCKLNSVFLLKVNFQYSDTRRRKGLLMAPLSHTWLCLLSVRQCS